MIDSVVFFYLKGDYNVRPFDDGNVKMALINDIYEAMRPVKSLDNPALRNATLCDSNPIITPNPMYVVFSRPCENMPTIPHEPSMLREVYDISNDAYVLVFHNDEFEDSAFNRPGSAKDMERIQQVLQHYRCDKLDINENKSKEYVQQKMAESRLHLPFRFQFQGK